jgi:uncharacterized phage protein gp47/JayE
MAFSIADTRSFIVALGKALLPGLNFGARNSYHGKRATFYAGSVTQIESHVETARADLHPLTAGDGKPINDWGAVIGVPRKGATPARKAAAGRVRGNAGAPVVDGQQLRHPQTGLLLKVSPGVTIPGVAGVDPDGFVDATIVAVDTGSQTRLEAGQTLTFLTQPPGIQANVILQLDLDEGGTDAEQFGGYRGRVLGTFSTTPSGGNDADFARWTVESLPTIAKGYSYPNRGGRGTIDVVGFYAGTGSARTLSSLDRAAVVAYIQTKAPFQVSGSGGGLRCLTTVTDPQRVEIVIDPNGVSAFDFDWDDSSAPTVLLATPATKSIRFSATLPASLRAGDSLMFDGAAGGSGINAQDGQPFKIESISAVDTVILETFPTVTPGPTDKIYSGGSLVKPIRDAIVAHLNGEIVYAGRGLTPIPESKAAPIVPTGPSIVGLDILAEGIGPANPGGQFGDWSGDIVRATLFKIATYKSGVRNATVVSPAVDYSPLNDAFPNDAQIHYVTPAVVLIRGA